jgi:type IV pilus assembly protein PilP
MLINHKKFLAKIVFIVVGVLVLASCENGEHYDLEKYIAKVKQNVQPKAVKPLEVLRFTEKHSYDLIKNIESPFREVVLAPVTKKSASTESDAVMPRYALDYPLDSLKFVGTLNQVATIGAIIKTPDGFYHRVVQGEKIGQNGGEIVEINSDSIKVSFITSGVVNPDKVKIEYIYLQAVS